MSIELEHLTKRFGALSVVDNVSLTIAKGEMFVLLGPSGSGKSTLLRMIAGLVEPDGGSVRLHGRDVTRVSPKDRGIGFVFQHYGLFRSMTVADNVEFALHVRRVPPAKRRERREELLQLVGLAGMAERYPRQLSGGQQQRVALARALAHEPDVLLLDEPFGALDAKIRLELRQALRKIQRELKLTSVFVTHDQEEAFELADRLAVLRDGRLLEVGEPQELYLRPRSPFVATFLGSANLLVGESSPRSVRLGGVELPITTEVTSGRTPNRTQVLFRPEDVEISTETRGSHARQWQGTVEACTAVGGFERLRIRLAPMEGVRAVAPASPFGAEQLRVDALRPQHEAMSLPLRVGDKAWIAVRRFHVLAPAQLRLLIDCGDSEVSRASAEFGRGIAKRLDAHVSTLRTGSDRLSDLRLDPASFELGGETENAEEGFDLLVLGLEPHLPRGVDLQWLHQVRHHLLLVARPAEVPARILVCVTAGEHGKVDVRFAERLAWQLGASATVLSVLSEEEGPQTPPHVERFMDSCAQALAARGVVTKTRVRIGAAEQEILKEIVEGRHDLLVIGGPHRTRAGKIETHSGIVQRFLSQPPPCPLLLVRR